MKIERYVKGEKDEKEELEKIPYDTDVFDLFISNVKRRVEKKKSHKTDEGELRF